jgi:hypothetical protein
MALVKQTNSPSLAKRTARALGARRVLRMIATVRRAVNDVGYEIDSRFLANPTSAKLFEAQRPALSSVQRRLVQDLETRGIAMVPFRELFGPRAEEIWKPFERQMREFAGSDRVKEEVQRYHQSQDQSAWKEYVVKHFLPAARLQPDDPVLNVGLQAEILDIVNSYLQLWSQLRSLNLWYTIPHLDLKRRAASQNWHRDPEDRRLVKVFLYFTEVDSTAGPLEYIPGSRRGGPYAYLWPLPTGGGFPDGSYPPQDEVEAGVPAQDRVVCTCPAATLVFCDTSGFHRGGYAMNKERLLGTWMYVTPASRAKLDFTVEGKSLPADMPPAARFALKARTPERSVRR